MDRLEPVLKQKFWILLGIGLIMSVTGWWMATSKLKAEITSRKAAIDAAFGKIPKGGVPNENWIKELNNLNANQEKAIALARLSMWKRQEAKMMTWPDDGEVKIEPSGYWGPFSTIAAEQFRLSYPKEVRKVWKVVNPFDPEDEEETGKGIVFFRFDNMYKILKREPWQRAAAMTSDAMWEIKEDLWLLERLFQSISDLNGGPDTTQNDAYVHQIDNLQLRGGGARSAGKGGSGPGTGFGGIGALGRLPTMNREMEMDDAADEAAGAANAAAQFGPSAALAKISVEFDAAEEFGADGSGAQAGPGGSMGGAGIERYIVKEDNFPYKTRGFYLSVKMDHRKIPQFVAELTANEKTILPIEVVRVQMSRLHEDEVTKIIEPDKRMGTPIRRVTPFPVGAGGRFGPVPPTNNNSNDDPPESSLEARFARGGARNQPGYPGQYVDKAEQERTQAIGAARATFDKVLSDPAMAQVTICGVFILYKKADEVADAKPATPTPAVPAAATPAAAPAESAGPETPEPAGEQPATTAVETPENSETAAADSTTTTTTPAEAPAEAAGNAAGSADAPADKTEPEPK